MKKILIIKHGAFGDIVLSLYAIFSINNHFKNSEITILTESKYRKFFKKLPFIKTVKNDNRTKIYNLVSLLKLLLWFCNNKFEWVFDLQTSNRTNAYYKLFSTFSKVKWSGTANKCSHPHLDKKRVTLHTIERQKEQLKIAGITNFKNVVWRYFYEDISEFGIEKKFAILVPGGSKDRPKKRWPLKNFIQIIKYFSNRNIMTVIIGGKDEINLLKSIHNEKLPFTNLVGKTNFLHLVSLAKKASFVIGNDTGPMHLISASSDINTLKIVLFGSDSDPKLCAPVGKNIKIIRKNNISDIEVKEVTKLIN